MKIALIRRRYAETGGAELYLERLLSSLLQQGHDLHLFSESWDRCQDGVKFCHIPTYGSKESKVVAFANAVKEKLSEQVFDVIFSLERTLFQDVYRAGDGLHRVWMQRRRQFAPFWRRAFFRSNLLHRAMIDLEQRTFDPNNTGAVIVNSEMVRKEILEHFSFPAERIHLVRNGIDLNRFGKGNRLETRARLGIQDDEILLLFVGSGWERKGLNFTLSAFRRLGDKKVKLLVVGKGKSPMFTPKGVIFAGPLTGLENVYAAADLLVFLPIYEPSSNVVAEALASGLPVITSAFNGASETVLECRGGAVINDPSDVEAVVDVIRFWIRERKRVVVPKEIDLGIDRNVFETLRVLEHAAQRKGRN
jgi:UDP-glucose:(heptosyl)LPS alpha-1,3-glucosyltransferase